MRVKCIAKEPQHFTGIETFQPEEVREVSAEQGDYLLKSPFIEKAESKSEQRRNRAMRGVESEE